MKRKKLAVAAEKKKTVYSMFKVPPKHIKAMLIFLTHTIIDVFVTILLDGTTACLH